MEKLSRSIDSINEALATTQQEITTDLTLTPAEIAAAGTLSNDTSGNAATASAAPPVGPAGGVLGGSYPNPTFGVSGFTGSIVVRNAAGTGTSTITVVDGRITAYVP
jgi:hypothetical protein